MKTNLKETYINILNIKDKRKQQRLIKDMLIIYFI